MALLTLALAVGTISVLAVVWLCVYWGQQEVDFWAISIYAGSSLQSLRPHPATGTGPVLSAASVLDTSASFVADPFVLRRASGWHMYFEVMERRSRRGAIAHAQSRDGIRWHYDRVVLREPFHLSYPHVFEDAGEVWMIPESAEAGEVRLYRAVEFPHRWQFECVLLQGIYYDATVIFHNGSWRMWAMDACYSTHLFSTIQLRGPWIEHPCSPVVRVDKRTARPGGRVLRIGGALLRCVQDGEPAYGSRLRALLVLRLDEDRYEERELDGEPLLTGSGAGWNATGMHHLDAQVLADGTWIAAVDGNQQRRITNWRAGARRLQREVSRLCTWLN
jgi:hypothetical protein